MPSTRLNPLPIGDLPARSGPYPFVTGQVSLFNPQSPSYRPPPTQRAAEVPVLAVRRFQSRSYRGPSAHVDTNTGLAMIVKSQSLPIGDSQHPALAGAFAGLRPAVSIPFPSGTPSTATSSMARTSTRLNPLPIGASPSTTKPPARGVLQRLSETERPPGGQAAHPPRRRPPRQDPLPSGHGNGITPLRYFRTFMLAACPPFALRRGCAFFAAFVAAFAVWSAAFASPLQPAPLGDQVPTGHRSSCAGRSAARRCTFAPREASSAWPARQRDQEDTPEHGRVEVRRNADHAPVGQRDLERDARAGRRSHRLHHTHRQEAQLGRRPWRRRRRRSHLPPPPDEPLRLDPLTHREILSAQPALLASAHGRSPLVPCRHRLPPC